MLIRLTVYNVAESTESNSAIGLVNGNLLWASATLAGYKVGIIDQKSFSGLTRSVSNIVNGGTFSTGYTGTVKITAKNATLAGLIFSKSLSLNGKTLKLEISETGAEWMTEAQFPITSASVSDELTVLIKVATETLADKKKISSVVVSQEMALNNANSSAIGKTVQSAFGNKVLFPLIYCEPSQANIAAMIADNGYSYLNPNPTDVLFNGEALDPLTETYPMWAPDFSFAKGSSILQCCGAWQSSVDSDVWLAFTFNGKELLASSLAGNATYLPLLRKALIGQRIKVVFGGAKDSFFTVENLEYASHEVAFGSTDIETLWFQVNTTELASFNYTLPNYSVGGVGMGTTPLELQYLDTAIAETNTFVRSLSDKATFYSVSQFCFVNNFELFIVDSSANIENFELFAKVDNELQKIASPYGAISIYKANSWQLVKILFGAGDENKIAENLTQPVTSYLFENDIVAIPQDTYLNCNWMTSEYGTLTTKADGVVPGFTELTNFGNTTLTDGFSNCIQVKTQSAVYSELTPEMSDPNTDICIMPEFSIKIANNFHDDRHGNFTATLEIKTFVISEGNVAILEKGASVDIIFEMNALELDSYAANIFVKPSEKRVIFSADIVSHKQSSPELYTTLADSLTFSSEELCENKNQIRGFLTSVSVHYHKISAAHRLDSRNLAKTFYTSYLATSKSFDKSNLYLKCVDSSQVTTPLGIVERIAEVGGISCDVDSFAETVTQQRAYFENVSSSFDGQYSPSSEESISDALDEICKKSLTCVLLGKDGTLKSKFLPSLPSEVAHIFTGSDIIKNSLTISQGDTASSYCDFDFTIAEDTVSEKQNIAINTAFESFPLETDVALGTIEIKTADGYSFTGASGNDTPYRALIVRGPSRELISMMVPGSFWRFENASGYRVLRIDTTAPDISCPVNSFGVRIGCIFVEGLDGLFVGTTTARLWGPGKAWKGVVSGNAVQSYGLAKSMWEAAKNARERLGSEIKAPSSLTEMKQPIWGSDKLALASWINATVQYCSKEKFVLKFETEATQALMQIDVLDYVSFAWGVFAGNSVNGFVAEKSENLEKGTFGFTLVCYGAAATLPLLLTEAGIPFSEETGLLFELEDSSTESQKISELTESSPEALAEAGAYIPTATDNIANNKVSIAAIASWIIGPINEALTSLQQSVANKVDKVTATLQTMQSGLKLPFLNLYSSLTGDLPTGASEGAIWYNGVLKRLTVFNGTDNKQMAHVEDVRNQAGMVTMPTITVNGFNITVGDNGVVRAYDNANWAGIAKDYNPTGGTFALNQNADNLLIYTAGVGYSIGTTINDWNLSNKIVVTRFIVGMGRVHRALENNLLAIGQCEQVVVKEALTTFYERVGNIGLGLTVTGLVPEISAAEVYSGPTREQIAQFTTATGTLYQAQVTGTTWTETAISAINTTIYNPSTGVVELPPSKWAWAYIYRTIGNDIEAYVRCGEEYFSTDTAALKGFKLPSTLDIVLAKHSMLVGYVLFQKGDTSIPVDRVFTPWDVTLSSSGVSLHESLPDLQGGIVGEHVHLTIEEKAIVTTASTTFAPRETTLSDEAASTTLPSTNLATLVGLLQTVRNCLKYLVTNMLDKTSLANNRVSGSTEFYRETVTGLTSTVTGADTNAIRTPLVLKIETSAVSAFGLGTRIAFTATDANTSFTCAEIEAFRTGGTNLSNLVLKINNAGTMAAALTCNSNKTVTFGASPVATSDDTSAATTAWVKDVCPQLSTGFSAGTKMWYGTVAAYQAIGTKDSNTIYNCY